MHCTRSLMAIITFLVLASTMINVAHCKHCTNCSSSNDCNSGQMCCSGKCLVPSDRKRHSCLNKSDCCSGEVCRNGKCSDANGQGYANVEQSCVIDSDCFPNQHCYEDKCSDGLRENIKVDFALLIALVVFGFAAFVIMIITAIMILIKILCSTEWTINNISTWDRFINILQSVNQRRPANLIFFRV